MAGWSRGVVSELLEQPAYVLPQGRRRPAAVRPGSVEQQGVGQRPSFIARQDLQQAHFRWGEPYGLLTGAKHLPAGKVDLCAPGEVQHGGLRRAPRPDSLQDAVDAGVELAVAEGLRDVVLGVQLQTLDLALLIVQGGEHDDRDVGQPAQAAGQLEAVEVREHHVEEDHVGVELLHLAEGAAPGPGHAHFEAEVAKGGVEQEGDVLLVVDDENPARPVLRPHAEMPIVMSPR